MPEWLSIELAGIAIASPIITAIVIALWRVSMQAGLAQGEISALKANQQRYDAHLQAADNVQGRLTKLETQMDDVQGDLAEIKTDLKELLRKAGP